MNIMMMNDFLFELLTEELPPKSLKMMAESLQGAIADQLKKSQLTYDAIRYFATPRRLAIYIHQLAEHQPDQHIERFGPNINAAFDKNGAPTKAALGFAHSCGVDFKDIQQKNDRLYLEKKEKGKSIFELMPDIINQALKQLPIPKPMRWGNHDAEFARPVHNVLMMYGETVVPTIILGLTTNHKTQGHRFLSPDFFDIHHPKKYEELLKKHHVIADFEQRHDEIKHQIKSLEQKHRGVALIDETLLNEVTSLVEWPVALWADFPKQYLNVPKEALISSIQSHQKCFPVVNDKNQLLPHFITISNIESKNEKEVIAGNQRVMNARLSDAEFFYQTDLKIKLENRMDDLKQVIFQKQLGTLFEKSERLSKLIGLFAKPLCIEKHLLERAALLSKTDLMTCMISEFPELQGIMGKYYALHDGEPEAIAIALDEQYMPRFAEDELPKTSAGKALALADRIDTLIGTFGIHQLPTGTKDPFGLRRAALGLIRITIDNQLTLSLHQTLSCSKDLFFGKLSNDQCVEQVLSFIFERLKYWSIDRGFSTEEFLAVHAHPNDDLFDFYRRLIAVQQFNRLPEADSLAAANKRVSNILAKQNQSFEHQTINKQYLTEPAEIALAQLIEEKTKSTQSHHYEQILKELATLKQPVYNFFDHVMVMVDDEKIKNNRLILLSKLRGLFLQVADISLLQK